MGKFDELTVFIEKLENDDPGYWAKGRGSGTYEDPLVLGYPVLSETARDFIKAFYHFEHEHPEYDLKNYLSYTDERKRGGPVDTDKMDEQAALARLMFIIRGDRFCDGLLLDSLTSGYIQNILKRLKEIDDLQKLK